MTEEAQGRPRRRSKLWIVAAIVAVLVAVFVIPPLVSINRYKSRIAQAMSSSLGRPVHLSAVELHLLPRPAFVITDLTVEEDPAYGSEPVLHANEVTAAIRASSLWRRRLEIGRISVDEASVNLVHTTTGKWNLDTLFRNAAQSQDASGRRTKAPLPYLEATNSRINIKQGFEKLPYSLLNADISFSEENPGDWRVRLKGQPARTDVHLDLGDTGIVQLEARILRAPELRLMPIHVELEWRDAQLGQLSRLLVGSDPGWRGDLRAEMKLDGNAESAQVTTRLRASGVHRAEFAPSSPLDFDANCGFVYHYSGRSIEKLVCDSPLGDGRLRIEGDLPSGSRPKLAVELQKIPAQAVLDALRTVRSEVGEGLEADGTLTGKLTYDETAQTADTTEAVKPGHPHSHAGRASAKVHTETHGPLTGNITVDGLRLSGGSLSQAIVIPRAVLEPTIADDGKGQALTGTANVPAGSPSPLAFAVRLTLNEYQITVRGSGTPARLKQIAHAAGLREAGALDAISGEAAVLDLAIEGPWLPEQEGMPETTFPAMISSDPKSASVTPPADRLTGSVVLHNASWKTDALTAPVQIQQATLHLDGRSFTWTPVTFSYGALKGNASLLVPEVCPSEECVPRVNLDFAELDAAELQSTLLGAPRKGTLLSTVLARLTPNSAKPWPALQGSLKAGSFTMGPVKLQNFAADMKVSARAADLTSLDAELLGGQIHVSGKVENGDKPAYSLEGQFQKVNPFDLCKVLAIRCTGSSLNGNGKLQLAGYTGGDLAGSAKGTLHFEWKKGTIAAHGVGAPEGAPASPVRFDHWTSDAEIANGSLILKDNVAQQGAHKTAMNAAVTFGEPPKVSFAPAKGEATAHK